MLMGAPRNALRVFNAGVSLSPTRSHGHRAAALGCRPACSLACPVIWMGLGAPSAGSSGSERYPFAYAAQSALSRCIYQAVLYISREKRLSHHRSLSPPIYECGGSREAPASPHTRFYLRRYADIESFYNALHISAGYCPKMSISATFMKETSRQKNRRTAPGRSRPAVSILYTLC